MKLTEKQIEEIRNLETITRAEMFPLVAQIINAKESSTRRLSISSRSLKINDYSVDLETRKQKNGHVKITRIDLINENDLHDWQTIKI
jgi:hypothetical protein